MREIAAGRHTLCVVNPDTLSYNPFTTPNLPYDPQKDFRPVTNMYFVIEGLLARGIAAGQLDGRIPNARCVQAGRADLRHARPAFDDRHIPSMARPILEDELRRGSLQGRQRDHQCAARRHYRCCADRRRQHRGTAQRRQDQGPDFAQRKAQRIAAECPDHGRSRLRVVSGVAGPGGALWCRPAHRTLSCRS